MQNDVISWHQKSRRKHCNNHSDLKLLNKIKEIQQKEREARMNTNGQDWNRLHLANLEKNWPNAFQVNNCIAKWRLGAWDILELPLLAASSKMERTTQILYNVPESPWKKKKFNVIFICKNLMKHKQLV